MIRRLTLLLLAVAAPAMADGVIDIRPTGAAVLTISASGSYRLVDDILMTANVSCITVNASNVTIDLNGHTIDGNGVATGVVHGFTAIPSMSNVTIRNGIIRGFGGMGISFSNVNAATVERVTVETCAVTSNGAAIDLASNGAVLNCIVRNNASTSGPIRGIRIISAGRAEGNRVIGNTSTVNSATGIDVSTGSTVTGNICNGNTALGGASAATGILAGSESTIMNNTCTANLNSGTGEARGISAGADCVILNNVCKGNNATAAASYGILSTTEAVIRNNNASNNVTSGNGAGVGISAGSGSVIEENLCAGNREGSGSADSVGILVTGQGGRVAHNTCRGNSATGGSGNGYGISVNATAFTIEGNDCTANVGTATGTAAGIIVFLANCRLLSNQCTSQTGAGGVAYGINIQNTDCYLVNNITGSNFSAGIILTSATGGNLLETNRTTDTTGIVNSAAPPTLNVLGAGDLANVAF